MNEDKRCRPILFNTDGPNAGDQVWTHSDIDLNNSVDEERLIRNYHIELIDLQVPFPMGVNFRTRPGKARSVIHEENHHGSPPNVEDLSNGDAPSGSAKESDWIAYFLWLLTYNRSEQSEITSTQIFQLILGWLWVKILPQKEKPEREKKKNLHIEALKNFEKNGLIKFN